MRPSDKTDQRTDMYRLGAGGKGGAEMVRNQLFPSHAMAKTIAAVLDEPVLT